MPKGGQSWPAWELPTGYGQLRRPANVSKIEMKDAATVLRQHQEHIEDLVPNRWNCEEIDRHQCLEMVVEEGTPSLRGRLAEPDHVLADAGLSDVDAEFEEFTVDTRRTPQRVFAAHGPD